MTDPDANGRVVVRDARIEDLGATLAVYSAEVLGGTGTFETEPPSLAAFTDRYRAIVDSGLPWLVAELDARTVGYAYAAAYRARPAYRHTVEDSIYVDAGARGAGVGRALLHALLERCERGGCRQLLAVVGDSANAGSIRLHAACGFRTVGTFEHVGHKHGRWLDTVLMQRALGAGATTPPSAVPADRRPGRLEGKIRIAEDFDETPPGLLDDFEGTGDA